MNSKQLKTKLLKQALNKNNFEKGNYKRNQVPVPLSQQKPIQRKTIDDSQKQHFKRFPLRNSQQRSHNLANIKQSYNFSKGKRDQQQAIRKSNLVKDNFDINDPTNNSTDYYQNEKNSNKFSIFSSRKQSEYQEPIVNPSDFETSNISYSNNTSCRSSLSPNLFTVQSENIKSYISQLFDNGKLKQALEKQPSILKDNDSLKQYKQQIVGNDIFLLSIQTKVKDLSQDRQKFQLIKQLVLKKLQKLISLAQAQRQCIAVQQQILRKLQQRMKKSRLGK